MKKTLVLIALAVIGVFVMGSWASAAKDTLKPPPGKHYNLNIIGFAQCTKNDDESNPDCFKGKAGDIETHGHTLFVPLVTDWITNPCDTADGSYYGDEVEVWELKKGVRILVSDGNGEYEGIQVVDRDATDGLGKLILPDGVYQVYARALGKPNGCMDIDALICYDEVWDEALQDYVLEQVDCRDVYDNPNNKYTLVGHLDVDRSNKKPRWENATSSLLPAITGVGDEDPGYFDFLWQIFNNNLRLLQLRIYEVSAP